MASELCMYYLRGNCRFGRKCWNSHDLDAYRSSENPHLAADESYAGAILVDDQPHGPEILIEESNASRIKQPNETEKVVENNAIKLSAATKEENNKSVKVNAKESPELEKKQKESSEIYGADFNDTVRCAIDSDLQCNICFEIFIKPTVLSCSHTFCETCIFIWTKRTKKCPICRMQIKSKSYCLTLDSFIEKIVENLPHDIKQKRGASIKDRNQIMIPNTNRVVDTTNRFNNLDLAELLNLDEMAEFDPPLQYNSMDQNNDINADIIVEESEMLRMNLHDTVVSTRGVNPLMSYIQQAPNIQANNSFVRH